MAQLTTWPKVGGWLTFDAMAKGPEKRNARITVRMPEELLAKIQEAAEADRRSVADWIVLQLEATLAKKAKAAK
ncbi:MAG: Arc family DNA-binding protein [Myxococcales bacterium]|nr:Arc family DNA-binding protein [Myxococcales bacterium]